eukprot:4397642-Pyramimonas_sp.AAC.1
MSHMKPIQPTSSPQGILPRDRHNKLNRQQREGHRDRPGLRRPRPLGGLPQVREHDGPTNPERDIDMWSMD